MSVKMPRVVPDQRSKFENEEFFRKLSRECEVSLFVHTLLDGGNKAREEGSSGLGRMLAGRIVLRLQVISFILFRWRKATAE